MKSQIKLDPKDVARVILRYLDQKYNNQLRVKEQDFKFVLVNAEGDSIDTNCFTQNGWRLKEIVIEYEDTKTEEDSFVHKIIR